MQSVNIYLVLSNITFNTIIDSLPKLWRSINKTYIYVLMPLFSLIYFVILLLSNIPYTMKESLVTFYF